MKDTPFESYVGTPEAVKELTEPFVKSTFIAFPRAVSAGQLAVQWLVPADAEKLGGGLLE